MNHRGKRVFCGCALILLMGTGMVHAREEQAEVIGCARDFSGSPVRGATVELNGINYQGGAEYGGDNGRTTTEWDGTFKLKMKKGTRPNPADAKVTVWSTIAGQRSRDRGGIGEKSVRNVGETVVTISPCIVVNGPFFIGGVVSGKDPTPRVGSAVLRLKLTTQNPVEVAYLDVVSHGGYEFSPFFAPGTGYEVFIERQPDDERCYFVKPPPIGTTGKGDIIDRVRFVQAVDLKCEPAPRPPWFVVVAVVTGKDATMRRGATLSLKLEPGGGAADSIDMLGNGRVEFKPILQPDTPFKVSVTGQPVDETCEVMPGAPNRTGASPKPGSGKNIIEVQVSCQSAAASAAPPDLGALPTRPGAGLGNSLASEAVAREDQRQRQREADEKRREEEERFRRLTATASAELDAECARRGSAFGTADIQAARQRKALFEGMCAKARQASVQIADADRMIAAEADAERRRAAVEADRQARLQASAPPGGSCAPDPGLLQAYIRAQHAFAQRTSGTMRPTSQDEASRRFTDYYKRFVENSDVRGLRADVAERRRQVSSLNDSNEVSRMTAAETRLYLQLQECGLSLKENVGSAGRSPVAGAMAPPPASAPSCEVQRRDAVRAAPTWASKTDKMIRDDFVIPSVELGSFLYNHSRTCAPGASERFGGGVKRNSPEFKEALRVWANCQDAWGRNNTGVEAALAPHKACIARQMLSEIGAR